MELCATHSLSTPTLTELPPPPNPNFRLLKPYQSLSRHRSLHLISRSRRDVSPLVRASFSEESSSGEDLLAVKEPDSAVAVEDAPVSETNSYAASGLCEAPTEESATDQPPNDFLSDLNIKFDSEDTYSIILYGAGALTSLWLASAVVSAIDSIPLFPKLMEIVGLGYSFWFTTRYLLFKKNRDELAAKVEELKQQILGSDG